MVRVQPATKTRTPLVDLRTPLVDLRIPLVDLRTPLVDLRTPLVDLRPRPHHQVFAAKLHHQTGQFIGDIDVVEWCAHDVASFHGIEDIGLARQALPHLGIHVVAMRCSPRLDRLVSLRHVVLDELNWFF